MEEQDDRLYAIAAVTEFLKERSEKYPGFDCLLYYKTPRELVSKYPAFFQIDTDTDIVTFTNNFFGFIKANNLAVEFITLLLISMSKEEVESNSLPKRIYDQMLDDEEINPKNIRRPTYHVAVGKQGLAIALAIDDRFWTNEW